MKNLKSIQFNIQGDHESHNGSADIISSVGEIQSIFAKKYNVSCDMVTVRKISNTGNYEIYESYIDSGSDDYMYFAISVL